MIIKPNIVLFSEIDKYAEQSYCAIHGINKSLNIGDITKVDENDVVDFNVMFGGSPCQDFSLSGAQQGSIWRCNTCNTEYNPLEVNHNQRLCCPKCSGLNIDKTRSSLLVEWLRFLKAKKPKFAIYENVKTITIKKFRPTFDMFLRELNDYGYNVYWKILNASDYNIPQNRERVFCVIIRKDIDNGCFTFPIKIPLTNSIYDLLEKEVLHKFYLPQHKVDILLQNNDINELIHSLPNDGRQIIKVQKTGTYFVDKSNVVNTIMSRHYKGFGNQTMSALLEIKDGVPKVRRFTPLEHMRFMGFDDNDYYTAKNAMNTAFYSGHDNSSSQIYIQTGNSIVVNVLYYILKNLQESIPYLFEDMKIGSFFSGIGAFEKALYKLCV